MPQGYRHPYHIPPIRPSVVSGLAAIAAGLAAPSTGQRQARRGRRTDAAVFRIRSPTAHLVVPSRGGRHGNRG